MKKCLRYEIYSDERQEIIDWRTTKKEVIRRAYELVYSYGQMTIRKSTTGEIVYSTAG